ncbi:helix-turn-helix domain-containing protein [Pseudomonas monteilii]
MQQATDLLLANLNGPMGIIEIARACHLTRSHFSRAFKLSTGVSPVEWRLNARLEKAKALLSTSLTLTEVGLEAGFCDQAHFTKAFTRLAGTTPKRWRAAWAVESAGTTLKR